MKNLIRKLFNHHHFELIELDFGDLYISSNDNKYYWLVVEQNLALKILELQDEWFEKCKEIVGSKDFDKNISLLILADKDLNEFKKQQVLRIEEDPFQFKKYVLLYTTTSLKNLIGHSENGEPNKLLDLIISEDVFNDYKLNYAKYNWTHLLYNIAHKLPFLCIKVEVNENLENLFVDAEDSLNKQELLEYSKFIEKQYEEEKLIDIDNLNLDELIEILNNDVENGN